MSSEQCVGLKQNQLNCKIVFGQSQGRYVKYKVFELNTLPGMNRDKFFKIIIQNKFIKKKLNYVNL